MVHYAPLIGTVAFAASLVAAAPMPYDSSSSSSDSSNQYSSSSDSSNQYSSSSDSSNQYSSSSVYSQGYSSAISTDAATSTTSAYGSSYSSSSYNNGYGYSSIETSSELATSTSSAYVSSSTYGSGSSYWGGSGYEGCVQQCIAEFGGGMSSVSSTDSSNTDSGYSGSTGTGGATHTVIVAPSQGVLRYVPVYTTANVGDTVEFVWHANEHTVTKSSELEICNKTSEAPVFASGEHNATFTFSQVINDTNPIYYYCGTPTHCEKGMFGMINAPSTNSSGSSVSGMLPSMLSNSSTLTAMWAYQQNVSSGNSMADSWGSDIDMSSMPSWSQTYMAQNILYTRTFLAANPEVMNPDGTIDMSKAQSWSIPNDLAHQLNAASAAQGTSTSASTGASSTSGSSTAAASATHTSGAGSITAPRVAAALVAIAATLFAL